MNLFDLKMLYDEVSATKLSKDIERLFFPLFCYHFNIFMFLATGALLMITVSTNVMWKNDNVLKYFRDV